MLTGESTYVKKNDRVFTFIMCCIHTGFGLFLSTNANATETADSNPAVRNTRLYDPGVGYDPPNSETLWLSIYTPARAGPIAIPINSKSAPTPTDIPVNSFGEDDTTMFHVAVIVNDRPLAIIAKFADIANSVEWNVNSPIAPIRLTIPPITVGFILPNLFIMNGVMLANTRNITMNGS